MDHVLSVKHLSLSFIQPNQEAKTVLRDVSFDIGTGETLALVGESGSGKSVTALTIMGLLPREGVRVFPTSQLIWQGKNLLTLSDKEHRVLRGRHIGMIFQDPMSSLNPVMSIGQQLVEAIQLHLRLANKQAWQKAVGLLSEVGIVEPDRRIHAYPHELSGGQQQRVMIAMAICGEPELLIADEPTTALDVTIQRQILELIKRLTQERKMSVLFITHDLALVGEFADRVVVMRHGEVREEGDVRQIFTSPHDAYTRALLLCRPSFNHRPLQLPVVEDLIRSPALVNTQSEERQRGIQPQDIEIIKVNGLGKRYQIKNGLFKHRYIDAVKEVHCQLYQGKTLGVVGESGSGKTTFGLMLAGVIQPSAGMIQWVGNSHRLNRTPEYIQIVFQNPYASLNPRFTIFQILAEPLLLHRQDLSEAERRERVFELMSLVGLQSTMAKRYPHEFSGGQRQRIAIARCLALSPKVLVCDESVSALDVSIQAQVLNLLQDLQDRLGITLVFISHDLSVVRYMADQIMVMYQGQVVEMGDTDELISHPKNAYTRNLLAAVPRGYIS